MVSSIVGESKVNWDVAVTQKELRKQVKEIIVKNEENFKEIFTISLPFSIDKIEDILISDDAVLGLEQILKIQGNFCQLN